MVKTKWEFPEYTIDNPGDVRKKAAQKNDLEISHWEKGASEKTLSTNVSENIGHRAQNGKI